jgi:translocation and assembly module TamB
LALQDVPVICEHVSGTVAGNAKLSRALTQQVAVDIDLQGHDLRFDESPAFEGKLRGHADRQAVALVGRLGYAGGRADLRARLPLDTGGRAPTVDLHAPTEAELRLRDMHVQALLAPVAAVSARSGTLQGDVTMCGTLIDPLVRGRLKLSDVGLVLRELGQPFEHVNSELVLDGKKLTLRETQLRDRDGVARISGALTWASLQTWQAQLSASVDDLPIRRQGVILARLDGRLNARADFSPKARRVDVQLKRALMELTNADFSGIQSLKENPEIVLLDKAPEQAERVAESTTKLPPIEVSFDASQPFWVRRDDFSALVSTKLEIVLPETNADDAAIDQGPTVSGHIELQRGVVQLIGTMFNIESGRIDLVGGHGVEPVLDLRAERRAPGGDVVAIDARGPLRRPTLHFFVNDEPVTAGEALAAASGARQQGTESSVQNQLGGMATGILSGVLTVGARRELGELVPVLAVETGDHSTSLRAGIGARRLIPTGLRSVITDAYVEGILTESEEGQSGDEGTRTQTQAGVLLELRFPYDLVGEAQYEPGQRWSLDLSWEP